MKRLTVDMTNRPGTTMSPQKPGDSIEDFRKYINSLESKIKEYANENVKLKQQLNQYLTNKNQYDIKKEKIKTEELINKYSIGKMYLNAIEKKIELNPINQLAMKDIKNTNNPNENQNDMKIKNLISQYEAQLEEIINKKSRIEDKLNTSEKEKEDLKTKFNDEFVLMSSVIYNLGFLYWSMKSDYEDKLKQNKGWLEMERIKQYNGDY
jgi:hypothetical protein